LVLFFTGKSKLGLLRVGLVIIGITISGWNCILKAKESAVLTTIHNTSFNLNWGGNGSYKLIKTSYLGFVVSTKILLAITKLLLPKFK
jgi:hypothetical protein